MDEEEVVVEVEEDFVEAAREVGDVEEEVAEVEVNLQCPAKKRLI